MVSELEEAYEYYTDDDLYSIYHNCCPAEKRRITMELNRRERVRQEQRN